MALIRAASALALILALLPPPLPAGSDPASRIAAAVASHEQVMAARARVDAATGRLQVSRGAYYPGVDLATRGGWEEQFRSEDGGNELGYRELTLKATQLLWDFGLTDARIDSDQLRLDQQRLRLQEAEEQILFDAVAAHLRLDKARRTLGFARMSEQNVRRQTGIEEIRITAGSGLNSDLLQAKGQLAGAMARRVESESQVIFATNRFRNVYEQEPPASELAPFQVVDRLLPPTVEEALQRALDRNSRILVAAIDVAIARESVKSERAGALFPRLEASLERNLKDNVAGLEGYKRETLLQLRLSYSFNLGMTAGHAIAAADSDLQAALQVLDLLFDTIDEEVRNSWRGLHAAREKAQFLLQQAELTAGFLAIAEEERALGNRSLIDVLAAETSLINARSDAEAARSDLVLEAVGLLRLTGDLNMESVSAMLDREASPAPAPLSQSTIDQAISANGRSMRLDNPLRYHTLANNHLTGSEGRR